MRLDHQILRLMYELESKGKLLHCVNETVEEYFPTRNTEKFKEQIYEELIVCGLRGLVELRKMMAGDPWILTNSGRFYVKSLLD